MRIMAGMWAGVTLAAVAASGVCGAEITADGAAVKVAAGTYAAAGRTVSVTQATTLPVAPAPVCAVTNEPLKLSADKPAGWSKGTRLAACSARDVNACGAFVPGSLVLRGPDGKVLAEGKDYLVDVDWGHLGLAPSSSVTIADTVRADYRVSHLRLDTIQVSADGRATLKPGEPHISAPVPPEADAGCTAIAHVLAGYRDTVVRPENIWSVTESAAQAVTCSSPGRLPKTMAKIRAGGPVTIVCWGDSVTAGGNASVPERRYVDVFAAGLRERFPAAKIEVKNVSMGGSHSRQWLSPDQFKYRDKPWQQTGVTFQRVLDAKPDLVTLEFVNDAGMTTQQVDEVYTDILGRVRGAGAELLLITPHFTMPRMMGFEGQRGVEKRPYVLELRRFAEKNGVAIADAAARWEHLAKEGLPYLTLLHNTINHPDDRGHRLFAEEMWKCFAP